jgi:hypothetical protein
MKDTYESAIYEENIPSSVVSEVEWNFDLKQFVSTASGFGNDRPASIHVTDQKGTDQ